MITDIKCDFRCEIKGDKYYKVGILFFDKYLQDLKELNIKYELSSNFKYMIIKSGKVILVCSYQFN